MAETRLKVVLETTGQGKLKAARKDSDQLAKALGKVGVQSKSAANGIRLTGRAAAGASRGVKGLTATIGQLALALGGIAAAANVFNTSINREESERRIKLVAAAYGEAAGLAEAAGRAAKKFGIGQTEANLAIADTFARLKPLGTSLKDIESVYSGFNTAVKLSGVSAEEAQSAFRQLNQALGSGVLRGDEFTRISEAIPSILVTIADEMDVTIGELKKLGSEGKLTSQVVVRALKRVEREGADRVAESLKGPRQQMINLKNAGEDLASELGEFLLPAMIELVTKTTELAKGLQKVFEALNKLPKPVKDVAAAFTTLGIAIAGIGLATGLGAGGIFAKIGDGAKAAIPLLARLGGGAKTVATGWTIAGGAITKTSLAITATTLALGTLKAALAIGTVVAWAKIIFDINAEINETNRLLNGGTEVLDELEQKIIDTQRAINEAARATGFWEGILNEFILGVGDADGALSGLNQRLDEFLRKRAKLRVFQGAYTSKLRGNSAGYNSKIENTKAELAKQGYTLDANGNVIPLPKTDVDTGGAKPKEDPVPGLTRQLAISDKLLANQRATLEAQFNENAEQVKALQLQRVEIEREGKIAEINAEDISDKAKQLKILLAQNEALNSRQQILADDATRQRDLQKDAAKTLSDLQDELDLLNAKIAGKYEEVLLEQQIKELKGDNVFLDEEALKSLKTRIAARKEELKAIAEKEAFEKAVANRLKKALEDALVGTLEAALDKTKDLGEALQEIASSLLKDLGRLFLRAGINGLGSLTGLPGFAEGGYVTGPTPALVGEGGEPEYIIPQSKMAGAMARYASGTRGAGVIDGPEGSGGYGSAGAGPMSINISGGVTTIDNTDYIRKDQVPSIIAQASQAGEQRTLRKLQQSPATRRRVGV